MIYNEPTVYKAPNVYKGQGGGEILFYTNFENFDINDNIDTPLIGNSYEVVKASYITLQKKDYCLSFKENQDSNQVNVAFKKIENNKHTRLIFDLKPYSNGKFVFFWFSKDIDRSDFGFLSSINNNNEYEYLVAVKSDIISTLHNLTFVRDIDVWKAYKTDFPINEVFISDIVDDENNRHVYLNGYKILDLPQKNELYLRPSPRNLGEITINEIITYK